MPWDENGRLCKVGRVRVTFDPPLPVARNFRQELKLREGVIEIACKGARLNLWVDAGAPVVRLETEFAAPVRCRAAVELWRLRQRPFGGDDDSHSGGGLAGSAFKPTVLPDVVVASEAPRVVWYHRNTRSIYGLGLRVQHLEALKDRFADPLLNLTFGASVRGSGFVRDGGQAIKSAAPATRHVLSVTVLAAQTGTAEEWLAQLDRLERKSAASGTSRQGHEAWWGKFWDRSWIFAEGGKSLTLPVNAHPWRVGVASDGGSRFGGTITGPRVIGRALSAAEIVELAGKLPSPDQPTVGARRGAGGEGGLRSRAAKGGQIGTIAPHSGPLPEGGGDPRTAAEPKLGEGHLTTGCTVTAWIKPAPGEAGRILDKCTAGRPDGLTFDTHPGLSLRWIVGDHTMIQPNCLKPGQWQHVAATADADTGVRRIYLNGKLLAEEQGDSAAAVVTRGYVLQRFMNACAGRGGSPIKFNGSIFTVEARPGASPETPDGDPDWRLWGGNYWFQNTRLAYWPMLAAGDFDLLAPWFHMYREALPLGLARIQTYYGFTNAAQFPETMYWWGLPNNGDYGWNNQAPEPANSYISRYWNGSLELVALMLDRYDFTQDREFARETLVPLADPLINFLNRYWTKRDAKGKIIFAPAQSLETWHSAVNPMPEIAGLWFLLPRLLALPPEVTTAEQRARWRKMLAELPPVPVAEAGGAKLCARRNPGPARATPRIRNCTPSSPSGSTASGGRTSAWPAKPTPGAAIATTWAGARTAFRPPASGWAMKRRAWSRRGPDRSTATIAFPPCGARTSIGYPTRTMATTSLPRCNACSSSPTATGFTSCRPGRRSGT